MGWGFWGSHWGRSDWEMSPGVTGGSGVSVSFPCPTDAPLPEGLSRLFAVLGELESCHRRAEPPEPPAPALLQLQT